MKKILFLALSATLVASAAFAQITTTPPSGAASTAVGAASKVASSDMGPGIESLKADAQEDYTVAGGDTLKGISASVFGDYRYWPIVYMTNKETIPNPELIEPGLLVKIYKLPFDSKDPGNLSKLLIAETYLQTYARYVELGADWVGERRWVLLEAKYFSPDLFTKFGDRLDASDVAWHQAR